MTWVWIVLCALGGVVLGVGLLVRSQRFPVSYRIERWEETGTVTVTEWRGHASSTATAYALGRRMWRMNRAFRTGMDNEKRLVPNDDYAEAKRAAEEGVR